MSGVSATGHYIYRNKLDQQKGNRYLQNYYRYAERKFLSDCENVKICKNKTVFVLITLKKSARQNMVIELVWVIYGENHHLENVTNLKPKTRNKFSLLSYDPYGPARAFIAKLLRKSPYEGRTRWCEQGRKKPSGPARIAYGPARISYGSSRDAN